MSQASEQTLARLSALDKLFHHQTEAEDGGAWFDVVQGSRPVLVSAPHACMHERDGIGKMQEEYTGALALYLAKYCDCHAIVTSYQTREDPNWQSGGDYKNAIKALVSESDIRFVIDLHGMMNRYHMGVALGTINGTSCSAEFLLPHFLAAGFQQTAVSDLTPDADHAWRRVVVDHPKFTGGVVSQTVTRFVATQLEIPSVQIEFSSETRVVESAATDGWPYEYTGNRDAIVASIKALTSLVAAVE